MKAGMLKKAIQFYEKSGYGFLATASAEGLPHIACVGKIDLISPDSIAITEWFCPRTVRNLSKNPSLSLVLWDQSDDRGYQLLGTSQRQEDTALLNGYSVEEETRPPLPQVEWKLLMSVNKVLEFTHAPHNDVECEE